MAKAAYVTANCNRCGKLSQVATKGLCFTCYRKDREATKPELANKRRAYGSAHAKKTYEARKLARYDDLAERLTRQLLAGLTGAPLDEPASVQYLVTTCVEQAIRPWLVSHERRSKLILEMERIETEGKTPIVVAQEDLDNTE